MSDRRKDELIISRAHTLHPASCASSIRYFGRIFRGSSGRRVVEWEMMLTDCDRQIKWDGWGKKGLEDNKQKLQRAVDVLNTALFDLETLEKRYGKKPTKKIPKAR